MEFIPAYGIHFDRPCLKWPSVVLLSFLADIPKTTYNIAIDLFLSQRSPSDFVFAGSGAAAQQGKQVFFSLYKKAEGVILSAFFVPVNKTTK